jgi:hypothetical protein
MIQNHEFKKYDRDVSHCVCCVIFAGDRTQIAIKLHHMRRGNAKLQKSTETTFSFTGKHAVGGAWRNAE